MSDMVNTQKAEKNSQDSVSDAENSLEENTKRIKEVGRRTGATVVGVASVDVFNEFVPKGHRPEDLLPNAKSVVVAGNQGPTAGAWQSPDHRVMEITGYDFRENVAIHVMCDTIEREYRYQAIQAPSLPTGGHHPPMSMMLAAVLAGLGTRSLAANIILNPEYGLLYYAALITTMPLQPNQRLEKDACPSEFIAAILYVASSPSVSDVSEYDALVASP